MFEGFRRWTHMKTHESLSNLIVSVMAFFYIVGSAESKNTVIFALSASLELHSIFISKTITLEKKWKNRSNTEFILELYKNVWWFVLLVYLLCSYFSSLQPSEKFALSVCQCVVKSVELIKDHGRSLLGPVCLVWVVTAFPWKFVSFSCAPHNQFFWGGVGQNHVLLFFFCFFFLYIYSWKFMKCSTFLKRLKSRTKLCSYNLISVPFFLSLCWLN